MKLLTAIVLTFNTLAGGTTAVDMPKDDFAIQVERGLEIGDYVALGKVNGEEIVWRYVADDENGKLMLSENIVKEEPFGPDSYWEGSHVRSWLNSDEGFLHSNNFSPAESALIKTVTLSTGLDANNYDIKDGGENLSRQEQTMYYFAHIDENLINLNKRCAYGITNEKMFLLDISQFGNVLKNADILFDEKDEVKSEMHVTTLRNAYGGYVTVGPQGDVYSGNFLYTVYATGNSLYDENGNKNGDFYRASSIRCDITSNIRPAFYLKDDAQVVSGWGTKEKPYRFN